VGIFILFAIGMSKMTVEVQNLEVRSAENECSRVHSRTSNSSVVGSGRGSSEQRRRKSITLLGIDSPIDEWLEWRVKWGQRGAGLCGLITLIYYVASGDTNVGLQITTVVFCTMVLMFACILYYKNISFVIVKRLFRETNVVFIVILVLCNCSIDIMQPHNPFSPIFGILYMFVVNGFVFIDALKVKSRILVITMGSIFILLNVYNIYGNIFTDANEGLTLLNYTIQGKKHSFMKRSTKRSIFLQILLFSMSGIYTMFIDKNQKLMMFATGNIYRETGTASKHIDCAVDECSKQGRRETIALLGIDKPIDERLEWRVNWGQRGAGLSSFIALMCYVASGGTNVGLIIATVVFCITALLFFGMFYYKNISFVVVKRLLCESKVIVIVVSTLCVCSIDIVQPYNSFAPILGIIYIFLVNAFVFMDALKVKSRIFVIAIGSIFTLLYMYLIYRNTFGDANVGVILLKYTTDGEEYSFMNRSTKRSIFLQILLFSMSGIYTMFVDKNQELMMFATGNIYRETGTASKHVEDTQYSVKMKRERKKVTSSSMEKNGASK
jgi:hypothetical protein